MLRERVSQMSVCSVSDKQFAAGQAALDASLGAASEANEGIT